MPFGLDASSVTRVRVGLLDSAAKAVGSVSASDMVSERVADSDLRQGVDRLRQRLMGNLPLGLSAAGHTSWSQSARPSLADREVTLDPVTRQLVDVGAGGGSRGYRYTTLEDTMRMIKAHREGGAVAVAWG